MFYIYGPVDHDKWDNFIMFFVSFMFLNFNYAATCVVTEVVVVEVLHGINLGVD